MKNILIIFTYISLIMAQSSSQLKEAKKMAQKMGLSESEVINAAKSRGYNEKEINAAIEKSKNLDKESQKIETKKVENISSNKSDNNLIDEIINDSSYDLNEEDNKSDINAEDGAIFYKTESKKSQSKYFGYSIFQRDPGLFQASSVGTVDPNYLIGPGDEIIIMLWGETQFRQVLKVDREGFVFIPEIGQVFVNGLNLNLLESKLFRVFSQSYASLNPLNQSPTTFLDVSLGNLRPLRIQVLGEISQPGAYTVSPSATLFSSLYYFNGPTIYGSLRDIQLIRNGKKIKSIDFYDYLLTGKSPKDEKLQLDDVIFIPNRLKTVSIVGEIKREGIYELKAENKLMDLISFAGGLKISAYLKRAQIDRIVPFEDRESSGMERMYIDVELDQLINSEDSFLLKDGDQIQIFSVLDFRSNVVELRGAVTRPGSYDLGKSLKLSDLINNADGLLGDAYLDRVDVVRIKPDVGEELIKLDLKKVLDKNIDSDIFLQSGDRVKVYGLKEMIPNSYVYIDGHIKKPGEYLLQDNLKVFDLIFIAGGFLSEEFKGRAYLDRADIIRFNDNRITSRIISFNLGKVIKDPNSKDNLLLNPGDKVKIYSQDLFISKKRITINGSVNNAGVYDFKSNMNLKDLIIEAGGLSDGGELYKVEVARIDRINGNKYADLSIFDINSKLEIFNKNYEVLGQELADKTDSFILEAYDQISIRQSPFLKKQKSISIEGEVLYPGKYVITSPDERISDIIDRAGGLLPEAFSEASKLSRKGLDVNLPLKEIIKKPNSKLNFRLQDQDKIYIFPKPNIVYIQGEINKPGILKYVPNKRLKYYINLAGGLGPNANHKSIWIEYPNGNSKKYKSYKFFGPKVLEGSIIKIGREEDKEPFDSTEFAKEITSIIANLAQAVAVVILAKN